MLNRNFPLDCLLADQHLLPGFDPKGPYSVRNHSRRFPGNCGRMGDLTSANIGDCIEIKGSLSCSPNILVAFREKT